MFLKFLFDFITAYILLYVTWADGLSGQTFNTFVLDVLPGSESTASEHWNQLQATMSTKGLKYGPAIGTSQKIEI